MIRARLFRRPCRFITRGFPNCNRTDDKSMMSTLLKSDTDGRVAQFWPLIILFSGLVASLFYSQFWLSHDDSWYLIATRKFLEGYKLYVDIIEVNPPLNFYLTAPALLFANLTGLSDTVAYVWQICFLATLSGIWSARIVRRSNLTQGQQTVFVSVGLAGLFLLPIGELGQREHLLFVFAWPYFVSQLTGSDETHFTRFEQFSLGLVAALGIGLKPYFLLIPAAIVLVGPLKSLLQRAFAATNIGLATGLLAYAAFTVVVHPEFFSDVLSIAGKVYWAYGFSPYRILVRGETFAVLIFAFLLYKTGAMRDPASRRLAAAVAAALASYLLQFKGWTYHLLPLLFFLMLGAAWIAVRFRIFERRNLLSKALVISLLAITLFAQVIAGPYRPRTTTAFSPFIEEPGEMVTAYSTSVWIAFPFLNAVEGKWGSRFPAQWMVPGALIATREERCPQDREYCAQFEEILADMRTANTEDLLRYRPDIVYVDTREEKPYFFGEEFDYIEFQITDPRFAKEWANYRKVGTVDGLFDVYRRTGPGGE